MMFAKEGEGEVPQGTAEKWEAETPKGKSLPEKVPTSKKKRWAKKHGK